MARCRTCGAPVNLAPDGDPRYETTLQTPSRAYIEAVKALGEARVWLPTRTSPAAQQFPKIGELHAKIDSIIGPEVKG